MTKGIVIGTSEASKDFLQPLLDSIMGTGYPILVVSNGGYIPDVYLMGQYDSIVINEFNGWELAVIEQGKKHFDEFVHIHDTTLIKDISLFDKLFAIEGNVVLTKGNYHYMGKFVTKQLPNLPRVHDKVMAIMLEVRWLDDYPYTEFEPDLPVFSTNYEMVHGMKRMVLSNQYMIKWKGTAWVSPEQMEELTEAILKKAKI